MSFLVCTANKKFWNPKKEDDRIFLGQWCVAGMSPQPKGKILEYHWNDRSLFKRDFEDSTKFRARLLEKLVIVMNRLHSVNYDVRYWDLLFGAWLTRFLHVLLDRYFSLSKALEMGLVSDTWVPKEMGDWCPKDLSEYVLYSQSDSYNQFLYSFMIPRLKIPHTRVDVGVFDIFSEGMYTSLKRSIRFQKLKRGVRLALEKVSHRFASNGHIFVGTQLSVADQVKLQAKLKQIPFIQTLILNPDHASINKKMREQINIGLLGGKFENIVSELISFQIPTVYVESYFEFKEKALNRYPKSPKTITTAVGHEIDESFKFYAAESSIKKIPLVGLQHGGNYGVADLSAYEDYELNVFDTYLSWGWDKPYHNIYPVPSQKFKKVKRKVRFNNRLLWVWMSSSRYSDVLYSCPIGPLVKNYIEEQELFYKKLDESVKKQIFVRDYVHEYGWNQFQEVKRNIGEDLRLDNCVSFLESICSAKLVISTYNATTYLETFAYDIPTLIFWNPSHWELREEANPYFQQLIEVGVLHYSPESAAHKLNEIQGFIDKWWNSEVVKQAVHQFKCRFVKTDDDWLSAYAQVYKTIEGRKEFL